MPRNNGPTGSDADRIAALEALVTEQSAQIAELLRDRLDSRERVERVETALGANPEDLASFAQWKEWAALSAQQKSQLEVDRTWPEEGLPRWRVGVWNSPDGTRAHPKAHRAREMPELHIPARGEDEAKARYARLCGNVRLTVPEMFFHAEPVDTRIRRDLAATEPPEEADPYAAVRVPEGAFEEGSRAGIH